jgi:two-component system, sensor histidine kinase and response regulator
MQCPAPGKFVVLVVDDSSDGRLLARTCLTLAGYEVVEAASGEEALALAEHSVPDVMLLDVCMPGMDGFQVCTALRSNVATRALPVLLVSAASDRVAISKGFSAGAVDFLAKPFRAEELCARVAVHAELGRARRELEASYSRLAALTHEKDMMFGMAAHDMRGPLTVISGFVEHALSSLHGTEAPAVRQALEVTQREVQQMGHFLGSLLDLNALERGAPGLKSRTIDLMVEARDAVERAARAAKNKRIELHLESAGGPLRVKADRLGLRRILDNFISNAVKFTPAGGHVRLRFARNHDEAECYICDDGPGLTERDLLRVFCRFARLSAKPTGGEKSTGLGLAICRALAEGMDGRVWCGNNPEGGAFFAFALPAVAQEVRGGTNVPFGRLESEPPFPHLLAEPKAEG